MDAKVGKPQLIPGYTYLTNNLKMLLSLKFI